MDLPKKNLAEINQLESSESLELNPQTIAPLDGLLNLLVDLQIINPIPEEVKSAIQEQGNNIDTSRPLAQLLLPPSPPPPRLLAPAPCPLPPAQEDNGESPDTVSALERLQDLILGPELSNFEQQVTNIEQQLSSLEHQIYDPQQLLNLLLPLIAELLSRKIADSTEEIVKAIAPIIDKLITNRSGQDKAAMISALTPLISAAISKQINESPEEIAQIIAPTMGKAIKEQIRIESDAMVDALYPVIGNTIAKYMAEAIRSINEQVANTLSVEGIKRKIRAKVQGVSEAELILQGAMPFTVPAIFLIHKSSGLVICEVQQSETQRLESEMVAGMLTAIRSFANECMTTDGSISELNQIDYGSFKIVLEVAGYCYLAVVVQGEPSRLFYRKIGQTLSIIVKDYGKPIELFDGDTATIPQQVNTILERLRDTFSIDKQQASNPYALLIASLVVVSIIAVPWGIYQYRHSINRRIEANVTEALASAPELAVYRLTVDVRGENVLLAGRVPNRYLRSLAEKIAAEKIAKGAEPQEKIDNKIIAVEVPPDPVLAASEVKRVTKILNQMSGVSISAQYAAGKVTVEGTVRSLPDAQKITKAFEQIPGVRLVINTVQLKPLQIATRIYFEQSSANLNSADDRDKLEKVKSFLNQYSENQLKIIGYSDPSGSLAENQQLALERAKIVRDALVALGIDSRRMQVVGIVKAPSEVDSHLPLLLNRYVEFQPLTQAGNSN